MLDDSLIRRIRQLFGNNLSKGVNTILHKHLIEENQPSGFGSLKGKISAKDIIEDDSDEPYTNR